MRLRFAAANCVLLGFSSMCFAQAQGSQAAQSPQTAAPTQTQIPNPQAPLRVAGEVMSARLLSYVPPDYPVQARFTGVSGTVVLHAIIGKDGRVKHLTATSGPGPLIGSAIAAAKQWRYRPTTVDGKPVEIDTTIWVTFTLNATPRAVHRAAPFIFKSDVRDPGSSHVSLTESIEVSGEGDKKVWTEFMSAFEDATSHAWLAAIPASAEGKKGKVIIDLILHRDGTVEGPLSLMQSSGDPSVDAASQLAIQKAAPFHVVPVDEKYPAVEFRVTFAYNHPHPVAPSAGAAQ